MRSSGSARANGRAGRGPRRALATISRLRRATSVGLAVNTHADKAARFLELHRQEHPLLLANAWDVGSAKLLASLGFQALATTSSGYAASLGRSRLRRQPRGGARARRRDRAGGGRAGVGGPRGGLRDRPGRRRRDRGPRARDRPRGLLGRGLGPSRAASVRRRRGCRARRRGRRGSARRARAPRAHRARREPPAGQPGRARHDRAPAGLPAGRRRRLYRPRARSARGPA